MVCVTVAEKSVETCLRALENLSFAEIRLDAMDIKPDDLHPIFSCGKTLVATCRPGRFNDDERLRLLLASIDAGASFVDVEVDSEPKYRASVIEKARSKGCRVIVSFHDYEKTPERAELLGIIARCFELGADIPKIACRVNLPRDAARLVGLLDSDKAAIIIGMGAEGGITRVIAPLLGSPFTYGAIEKGREVVDGQLDQGTLERVFDLLRKEMPDMETASATGGGGRRD